LTEYQNTQPLKSLKVLVLGDSCYDYYHYGKVSRISPEAPVPIFDLLYTEKKLGMASNVIENLKHLDLNIDFVTTFYEIKHRYLDSKTNQQIIRIDEKLQVIENNSKLKNIDYSIYDAIVISDYNKGFISYEFVENLRKQYTKLIFIDTKKPDLTRFSGCLLKINNTEWQSRTSDHDNVIVTRGGENVEYQGKLYYPPKVSVYDVCGAGDTFFAAFVVRYLETNNMDESILFAIKSASITISKVGVYAPTRKEIENG
jgi:D-glycero-beta-D-manno-heptose-7-phosphate kinase